MHLIVIGAELTVLAQEHADNTGVKVQELFKGVQIDFADSEGLDGVKVVNIKPRKTFSSSSLDTV